MFLAAVYYFVGMSKLTEEERSGYIASFNTEANLKLIKAFFQVFKDSTESEYTAQIDEVLAASNYAEMAPKFMALLSKVIENKDLESLICYCDDVAGLVNDKFFFNEILNGKLQTICDFSGASSRILDKIRNGGTNNQYEFRNINLPDVTKPDILGLTAFDLATIACASVSRIPGVDISAINSHQKLFDALIYQDGQYAKQAFNEFKDSKSVSARTIFFVKYFKLDAIQKHLPEKESCFEFEAMIEPCYKADAALSALLFGIYSYKNIDIVMDLYNKIDPWYFISNFISPILYENSSILKRLPNNIVGNFVWAQNHLFNVSIALYCGYISYHFLYTFYHNAVLGLPLKISLIYEKFKATFPDTAQNIEDYFQGTYIKSCMAIASQIVISNITYNIAISAIDKWFNHSSLASQLMIGAITYAPIIIPALAVADKFIYKCAYASEIDGFMLRNKEGALEGITSASR